ncbi:thiamine phosphate synthase [Sphingomonas suaedae]|uniref:Thiamine phosphate synthase n=1 Tax=Sphingomonas suaedae TaxID=2599297 RepID=A0A518RI18_9SPHN|nr:thiamine phosphate synthase [Sphingomonas suaedae]QDX27090.1 thiamine phosphate synthase [Sphingomonas suaedae]
MPPRHPRNAPLPRRWLMTDERLGDALWNALEALPRGSGVVFRHYATPSADRRALFDRVVRIARRKRLTLVVAGSVPGRGADGRHERRAGALTAPVHSRREAVAAVRAGAKLLFASPIYATRSHPGTRALGRVRFGLMSRGLPIPVIALGGMDERRWRALRPLGVYGWAGIDAWAPDQKRIAVPT